MDLTSAAIIDRVPEDEPLANPIEESLTTTYEVNVPYGYEQYGQVLDDELQQEVQSFLTPILEGLDQLSEEFTTQAIDELDFSAEEEQSIAA